jgi:hypothetical protein
MPSAYSELPHVLSVSYQSHDRDISINISISVAGQHQEGGCSQALTCHNDTLLGQVHAHCDSNLLPECKPTGLGVNSDVIFAASTQVHGILPRVSSTDVFIKSRRILEMIARTYA